MPDTTRAKQIVRDNVSRLLAREVAGLVRIVEVKIQVTVEDAADNDAVGAALFDCLVNHEFPVDRQIFSIDDYSVAR